VYAPTNILIITSLACTNCHIFVRNTYFSINLICLPLPHLDIVFGMDLLSSNHVLLNYHDKILIFESHIGEIFYSKELKNSTTNHIEISKRISSNMILIYLKVKEISKIYKFPIFCEYLDIIHEGVPKLPLKIEIEFTIDLVARLRLVSIAYRMLPLHLRVEKNKSKNFWTNNL